MQWVSAKTLGSSHIYYSCPPAPYWDAAEKEMKDGYLPPFALCQMLSLEIPAEYTRRHQWILSGAYEALRRMEQDASDTRKKLKAMGHQHSKGAADAL